MEFILLNLCLNIALFCSAAGIVRRRVMKNLMKDYSKHSMRFDLEEIPEAREARILTESLQRLEEQLQRSTCIAGPEVSLADIALFTEVEQVSQPSCRYL